MFDQHTIDKICNDERLQVPFYSNLNLFLNMDEEPLRDIVELVNDTNDISELLYNPVGKILQERLAFDPDSRSREEVRFAIDAFRDFYQMTAPEKVAMDLSDTEYAAIAYHMDVCFLDWLITNALQAL